MNHEKLISDDLAKELPKSLVNFLWYIWELHLGEDADEVVFCIETFDEGLNINVPTLGKVFKQDFAATINATIVILKHEQKYYMSRK